MHTGMLHKKCCLPEGETWMLARAATAQDSNKHYRLQLDSMVLCELVFHKHQDLLLTPHYRLAHTEQLFSVEDWYLL